MLDELRKCLIELLPKIENHRLKPVTLVVDLATFLLCCGVFIVSNVIIERDLNRVSSWRSVAFAQVCFGSENWIRCSSHKARVRSPVFEMSWQIFRHHQLGLNWEALMVFPENVCYQHRIRLANLRLDIVSVKAATEAKKLIVNVVEHIDNLLNEYH